MTGLRFVRLAIVAGLLVTGAGTALAQLQPQPGDASAPNAPERRESIEIGLSTDRIAIDAGFSGEDLVIFGAVDNIDPLIWRQGRYDLFVLLEGPRNDVTVRRKERVGGVWMNVEARDYENVPLSYLIATTRLPRDVTDQATLERLSLTIRSMRIGRNNRPAQVQADAAADEEESAQGLDNAEVFADEARRISEEAGLYRLFPGNVTFLSQSLFRARLELPANVPVGDHLVRAYLFRNGALAAQTRAPLRIGKAGLEFAIFNAARNHPFLYGLGAVGIALLIGWLGRVLFKKD